MTYILQIGLEKIVPQSVRFILTCLLAYSLVKGWVPGRWITVVLMGLAGIGSILGGVGLMTQSGSGLILIILGVVYVACVVGLLTPSAAKHFKKQTEPEIEQGSGGNG
ncbi:MAG: hypothetical protein ACSHX0_00540 [Akkermansiaceae bacterium]